MTHSINRRHVLGLGVSALLVGCSQQRQTQAGQGPGMWYRVQEGDNLSSIARRSGTGITDIFKINDLRSRQLQVGQQLWLPGATRLKEEIHEHISYTQPEQNAQLPYQLVTRQTWGAKPSKSNFDPMARISRITIHHTAEIPGMTGHNDLAIIQKIQRFHQVNMRWADIGYHYIIGHQGQVYQGRPETVQGAHAGGANNIMNLGISVMGEFSHKLPTNAQLRTLKRILQQKQQQHQVSSNHLFGHRDLGNTICPGDKLYAWFQDYKRGRI